ncbi:MAG: lytic transglycosylase domain-containing protein, partial [Deltaproteobacteria bacterium]
PKGGSGGINGYSKAKPYARRGASYDTLINNISSTYGIETALVKAIIKVESDFDTYAVSEDGAAGLMQLMPETAAKMGVKDIHDPGQNVRGGVKFFKKLLGTFKSDLRLALAAYNAGENAVLKYGKVPPYPETRNYVEKVLRYRDQYKKASG